jgi:hypothetical protein
MHLNAEVALDLVEGRLDQKQQSFWKQHIEICKDCAQDVERWQHFKAELKGTHLESAPEEDLNNAIQVFQPPAGERSSAFRSVVAAIVFDSFLQPAMAGVRGTSALQARQVVMRADDFDIHVKIWGDQDRRQMIGQLLPRESQDVVPAARFHLLRNGEKIESTTTDEIGEFSFTDVPASGDLSLQIDLPHLTVIGTLSVS